MKLAPILAESSPTLVELGSKQTTSTKVMIRKVPRYSYRWSFLHISIYINDKVAP